MLARGQRLDAIGVERVPRTGAVLLAARHYHHLLDGVGLIKHVKRPLHILVALDWISKRSTRAVMERLSALAGWPVTLRPEELAAPGRGRHAYAPHEVFAYQRRAFAECVDLLKEGRVLAVFPEGYPVLDPHAQREPRETLLAPFKPGFARLAVSASRSTGRPVHVVPVGIRVEEKPTAGRTRLALAADRPDRSDITPDRGAGPSSSARSDPQRADRALVFVFGEGREVTASTDVAALTAQTFDDVRELST